MKKVKVNAYEVGLVFRKGALENILTAGTYWFWRNEQVEVYDTTRPLTHP